jgi:hypothetical protein
MTTQAQAPENADACKCCEDGPGLERQDGHTIGRDPREMTPAELKALGHVAMTPLKVIRARCLDCCAGSASEVRNCTATQCPSWPMRMGFSPWRKPLSEAERNRRAAHAKKMRSGKTASTKSKSSDAKSARGGSKASAGTVDLENDEK